MTTSRNLTKDETYKEIFMLICTNINQLQMKLDEEQISYQLYREKADKLLCLSENARRHLLGDEEHFPNSGGFI